MKKSRLTKVIAVILALTVSFSAFGAVTASASSSYPIISGDSEDPIGVILADVVDTLLRFILDWFQSLFGNGPGFVDPDEDQTQQLIESNYYEGIGKDFASSAEDDAQWNVGYANASLIPDDYDNGTYYIGGYIDANNGFTNVVEGIANIPGIGRDDMKVRSVAISDGTGKGTVLFATIDCIGITNADIKDIREMLADYAAANNIVAINIASTHTHSCIDTEGLWTRNLAKLAYNGINSGMNTGEELQQGTNPEYMKFLKEKVADSLIAAYLDMKPGTLTYSVKDVGQDYFNNKNRPSAGQLVEFDDRGNLKTDGKAEVAMTDVHKFTFTPDDEAATPTIMVNMAAHPDVAGLPTSTNSGREISGDYIFYCGKYLEDAGYNFMFFQGAIAAIYMARGVTGDGIRTSQRVQESQRYGFELARMLLSMNKTEEEIIADPVINSNADEIEENTKLISIYNEDGTFVDEFTDNKLALKAYNRFDIEKGGVTTKLYNFDSSVNIVADNVNKQVSVMNGKYNAYTFDFADTVSVITVKDNKNNDLGVYKVEDSNGNLIAAFSNKAALAFALNAEGNAFVSKSTIDDEERIHVNVSTVDATVTEGCEEYIVAQNGKVYHDYKIPANVNYTVWYEGWTPVEDVEVEPYLNLYIKQVEVSVKNSLIKAVGKLNMANYVVLSHDDGTYSTVTEIGYMEIGDAYKTVMLPGEICQDLIAPNGKSLYASNSVTASKFDSSPACQIFGDDVACMGLMNDAIGYVVPDNDYTMGDPANHYHELISLGQSVGSELMNGLIELASDISYS